MVRCTRHGDLLLERLEMIKELRATRQPRDVVVAPNGDRFSYAPSATLPGGELHRRSAVLQPRGKNRSTWPTTAAELESRKRAQAEYLARRRVKRDTQ